MPELTSSYRPAWWLPGAHLPTYWGKKMRHQPAIHDRVERWATPDGDHLSIARSGQVSDGQPHLIVLHGLEGSTHSNYAQGLMDQARRRGWSADVMLFRGCDGAVNGARRMYHSGETSDLNFFVQTLIARHPAIDIRIVGVSLGGNVTLKWLGEQGSELPKQVTRAAGVSVPYDLAAGSRHLECFLGQVYVDYFMKSLKAKTRAKRSVYPDLCDWDRMEASRTFWEFDDCVTGPVHGFDGALDYYTRCSSIRFLDSIRCPTLLFNAEDDPFLPSSVLEDVRKIIKKNDLLFAEFSKRGGHVGWTEGTPWAPIFHMEERIVRWLAGE